MESVSVSEASVSEASVSEASVSATAPVSAPATAPEIITKPTTPKKCEAGCYGNCSGKISGRKFIYHYRPKAKNNKTIAYDKDVIVDICDLHHQWVLLKTKGKTPEMYGDCLADALDMLSCCDFTNTIYTFWYCVKHDDGTMILDNNIEKVPDGCKLCSGFNSRHNCDESNWVQKGVINFDGKDIIEIKEVQKSYSQYGGSFNLMTYAFGYREKSKKGDKYEEKDWFYESPIIKWFGKNIIN